MLKLNRKGDTSYLQDHHLLKNLDLKDQHPIEAIIGLKETLESNKPISSIEGLQEALDLKYEKPKGGIPASDLSEEVLSGLDFADNLEMFMEQIDKLAAKDEELSDDLEYALSSLKSLQEELYNSLRTINLILNDTTGNVEQNTKSITTLKQEMVELRIRTDNLINDVIDKLSSTEELENSIDQIRHQILDLYDHVDVELENVAKNKKDIQTLATAHNELETSIKNGDILDSILESVNKPAPVGRATIEQIDKINVEAGYKFLIKTTDSDLKVIEPTVLKLSIDDSNGVDILSDLDYNNREDFILTDSVRVDGGLFVNDTVELEGELTTEYLDFISYCYRSIDTSKYKKVFSISTSNGKILIEHLGRHIKYINDRMEVYSYDLTKSDKDYEYMTNYSNDTINLRATIKYRRLDIKVNDSSEEPTYREYEVPAYMINLNEKIIVKSQDECFDEYKQK